jgi:hypothetical protein
VLRVEVRGGVGDFGDVHFVFCVRFAFGVPCRPRRAGSGGSSVNLQSSCAQIPRR